MTFTQPIVVRFPSTVSGAERCLMTATRPGCNTHHHEEMQASLLFPRTPRGLQGPCPDYMDCKLLAPRAF